MLQKLTVLFYVIHSRNFRHVNIYMLTLYCPKNPKKSLEIFRSTYSNEIILKERREEKREIFKYFLINVMLKFHA